MTQTAAEVPVPWVYTPHRSRKLFSSWVGDPARLPTLSMKGMPEMDWRKIEFEFK